MRSKAYRGVAMEGGVARWYDARARRERDDNRGLAHRLAEDLAPGSAVLEVAPGPGYLAIDLARLGSYEITGLDISETFVRIARENAAREAIRVDFRQGDAARMPFENDAFDLVICRAAFQNFRSPVRALEEMRRVLKTGGKAVVIELRKDVASRVINDHVRRFTRGLIHWLSTQLAFRLVLVRRAYSRDELRSFVAASGLRPLDVREGPMFLELWLVK